MSVTVIDEKKLSFRFGERWQAFKLDDHPFYRERLSDKIKGTKAVDILGILDDNILYFIEIKDFRKYRIENKKRVEGKAQKQNDECDKKIKIPLYLELALKVRDSIACIVYAHRTENDADLWKHYAELLCNPKRRVNIVLWMESDLERTNDNSEKKSRDKKINSSDELRAKARANTYANKLKTDMEWFESHILVCNTKIGGLPDMSVKGKTEDSSVHSE